MSVRAHKRSVASDKNSRGKKSVPKFAGTNRYLMGAAAGKSEEALGQALIEALEHRDQVHSNSFTFPSLIPFTFHFLLLSPFT